MSDIIRLLPDSVANQIAAGEVIQRPASVIKELVENAVDAGATRIDIVVRDAGRTLIQVIDDGTGMTETDARMAFERHATSKIRQADDLFRLHTMGFRGEALPSICAIAQIELKTMHRDCNIGSRLVINGSKVECQEPCVCAPGTNLMVKNLFYNVPARRKFLKSDSVELANIMREFERLALVNNHLRMTLDTGSKQIDLRPGSLKQRITDLWKGSLAQYLIPVEVETGLITLSGFITKPEGARRRQPLQFMIVNGRNMRHPYFHKAIVSCYDGMIATDTQPCYFLKFKVDPETIDINIHPTKNEIKFEEEANIRPILVAAIRTALGQYASGPDIDFNRDILPFDPARQGDYIAMPGDGTNPAYNPFANDRQMPSPTGTSAAKPWHSEAERPDSNWEKLYQGFTSATASVSTPTPTQPLIPETETQSVESSCIQYAHKYVVTSLGDRLVAIDQHRAHVKVLYERFVARASQQGVSMQRLMFPQNLTLDTEQEIVLDGISDRLRRLGFQLENRGQGNWSIVGTPVRLSANDAAETIRDILAEAAQDEEHAIMLGAKSLTERIALVMARSAAIRGGQKLSPEEMERLVNDLMRLPDPMYTPDGNPIMQQLEIRL